MNKLTAKDIIDILKRNDISVRDFAHCEFESDKCPDDQESFEDKYGDKRLREGLLGEWDEVKHKGGEGQGDEWYSVKYFKDHDVYIRTDGWYTSHHGTDFEDGYGYEVKPLEKVVTFYE